MKFSGGQSIVSLDKDEISKIGVQDAEEFQNFWIEKYKFNNYRVYGNKNWENDLQKLNFFTRENIELDSKKFTNDKVFCIKFNKDNVITRFNPESIYRSRYWTIQNKIIDQIITEGSSIILIQRREEIIQLEELYENIGFYIPSKKATVARRLELLHESAKNKKIIIAHISEAENIITDVDQVYLNYDKDDEEPIHTMTNEEAKQYQETFGAEPSDLEHYVAWSQYNQTQALTIAARACLSRFPEVGGFLIWMGHDAWPCAANTAIIDFDGNPKPAYHALKAIFAAQSDF